MRCESRLVSIVVLVAGLLVASTPVSAQPAALVSAPQASAPVQQRVLPNRPLLLAGAAMVVVPYFVGVAVELDSGLAADERLKVPVVGPWMDLAQRPCREDGEVCSRGDELAKMGLIVSGILQAAGVVFVIESFFVPERISTQPNTASVRFAPMTSTTGGGIGAAGSF